MPFYFYLHARDDFHQRIAPALTASWRRRSFEPCRELFPWALARFRASNSELPTGVLEPLEPTLTADLPFDRSTWRYFVSQVLLLGAAEVPELDTAADSLIGLLAPGSEPAAALPREQLPLIAQAYFGSQDVLFGGYYRPDAAGLNDVGDVERLACYLQMVDTRSWIVNDLPVQQDMLDDDEREQEVEFARECLASLRGLYERAAAAGQVIVSEVI